LVAFVAFVAFVGFVAHDLDSAFTHVGNPTLNHLPGRRSLPCVTGNMCGSLGAHMCRYGRAE
jgi:hypothetical protein